MSTYASMRLDVIVRCNVSTLLKESGNPSHIWKWSVEFIKSGSTTAAIARLQSTTTTYHNHSTLVP